MELAGRSKLNELEKVITEYQDQLFRFAFYRTGCFEESQDIVQDVFIKVYRENGHLTFVNNIRFYLFKCIANACIDYLRKNKKLKLESIDDAVIPVNIYDEEASNQIILKEEFNRLENLLHELPWEQSETIRMRVFDNLSFVEIASVLDIPVTTIKSRFKYGIDKLKLKIETLKEVNYGLQ